MQQALNTIILRGHLPLLCSADFIGDLQDFQVSRTKRQVNAFFIMSALPFPAMRCKSREIILIMEKIFGEELKKNLNIEETRLFPF